MVLRTTTNSPCFNGGHRPPTVPSQLRIPPPHADLPPHADAACLHLPALSHHHRFVLSRPRTKYQPPHLRRWYPMAFNANHPTDWAREGKMRPLPLLPASSPALPPATVNPLPQRGCVRAPYPPAWVAAAPDRQNSHRRSSSLPSRCLPHYQILPVGIRSRKVQEVHRRHCRSFALAYRRTDGAHRRSPFTSALNSQRTPEGLRECAGAGLLCYTAILQLVLTRQRCKLSICGKPEGVEVLLDV